MSQSHAIELISFPENYLSTLKLHSNANRKDMRHLLLSLVVKLKVLHHGYLVQQKRRGEREGGGREGGSLPNKHSWYTWRGEPSGSLGESAGLTAQAEPSCIGTGTGTRTCGRWGLKHIIVGEYWKTPLERLNCCKRWNRLQVTLYVHTWSEINPIQLGLIPASHTQAHRKHFHTVDVKRVLLNEGRMKICHICQ